MKNKNIYIYYIIGFLLISLTFIYLIINQKSKSENIEENTYSQKENTNIADANIKEYLDLAILDEYKARDVYLKIIEKFGEVKPFSNIVEAEKNHIAQLESLYTKYNLDLPIYQKADISIADNIKENCDIGVSAEIANAKLYKDILIPNVSNYSDIVFVFTNLMNASQNNHLKAFERCN